MSTIVTRSGKGTALTHTEVDANFTNLNTDKAATADVILATQKGAASGVCPLDATSKILATYLPSYVDDVLEYANLAALPVTGETGKIYVALDTNKTYRWSGSAYIYITSGAVDSVAGRTGVVTLTSADVGLGNASNTSDANKPISTATQTALDLKSPLASPTFTGTVSGITKAMVSLGNVDNTTDANKPVSTATQTALDLKSPLASPTFTGTVNTANLAYTGTLTGSTGILNIGSGQVYKDASGKVGINVTPAAGTNAKLQITGLATNATTLATAYSDASLVVVPKSTSGYSLAIASGTNDFPQLQVSANGAASGDLLIQPYGGNVGIGTSSPSGTLHVSGGRSFFAASSEPFAVGARYSAAGGTVYFGASDATATPGVQISAATGAALLNIDSSGNVGIGTSSPSTYANGYAPVLAVGIGVNYAIIQGRTDGPTGATNGVSFGGSYSTNPINGSRMTLNAEGSSGQRGSVSFWTKVLDDNSTQPIERMRIDSSGIVTMAAYGAGAATFSAAGVISSVSDETWKIKDGVPVDADSMLKKLEPGYWFYNEEKAPIFGTDRQLGFYAQNVNEAIGPEAAPTPEEGKPWGYYDRSVLAVTVMSLQKALTTIESLTARLTALEAK